VRRFETESFRAWITFESGISYSSGSLTEQMDVLRHDHVAEDFESVSLAGEFEGVEENAFEAAVAR
jgi:hypothetical protein